MICWHSGYPLGEGPHEQAHVELLVKIFPMFANIMTKILQRTPGYAYFQNRVLTFEVRWRQWNFEVVKDAGLTGWQIANHCDGLTSKNCYSPALYVGLDSYSGYHSLFHVYTICVHFIKKMNTCNFALLCTYLH